jgi:ribosomal protein L30E
MAWVHKDTVTKVRNGLKLLNKEYGMKTSVSGTNSHSLKVKISSGKIDFITNFCETVPSDYEEAVKYIQKTRHVQVNHYWLDSNYSGVALEYLQKVKALTMLDHWDKSDIQSDYFHCSYYINIDIGSWNKPYEVTN